MTAGWETTSCAICGATQTTTIFEVDSPVGPWRLVRCDQCGLVYTDPRPSAEQLLTLYDGDYVEAEYKGYSDDLRLLADGREIVADIASRHPTATTLLDVGCGSGNILAAARERGWTACGVEVTEGVASRARELSGADVHVGDFMELPLSGPFDVVVMWQVLEHLPDPRAALQKVKNLMAPQGLLLITVPNFASTASQKQGPQWSGLKPGFHLYHYTPESLTRLLALTGFGKTEVLARSAISLKRAGEAHGGLRPLTSAARRLWRLQPRRVQKLISHRAARLAPGEGLWAYTHA